MPIFNQIQTGILIASGAETRPKNVAMMYIIKT